MMAKTGRLTSHMQAIRRCAENALETLTENTYGECGENPQKMLRSKFRMDSRFDIPDEMQLVHSAYRICTISDDITGHNERLQHAQFALGEPGDDEEMPVTRRFNHSASGALRQLDLEVTKFKSALKACLRQTRECKEDAQGKERRQLRVFSDALQEIKGNVETIEEHMAAMQDVLNFRKGPTR